MSKNPNVYIGAVKNVPLSTEPVRDDDEDIETPPEVEQILGFDPDELGDG